MNDELDFNEDDDDVLPDLFEDEMDDDEEDLSALGFNYSRDE